MESAFERFYKDKKTKSFYRDIDEWLKGKDINYIILAKRLSSMVTHSLVEVEHNGDFLIGPLMVQFQLDLIKSILSKEISVDDARQLFFSKLAEII